MNNFEIKYKIYHFYKKMGYDRETALNLSSKIADRYEEAI